MILLSAMRKTQLIDRVLCRGDLALYTHKHTALSYSFKLMRSIDSNYRNIDYLRCVNNNYMI